MFQPSSLLHRHGSANIVLLSLKDSLFWGYSCCHWESAQFCWSNTYSWRHIFYNSLCWIFCSTREYHTVIYRVIQRYLDQICTGTVRPLKHIRNLEVHTGPRRKILQCDGRQNDRNFICTFPKSLVDPSCRKRGVFVWILKLNACFQDKCNTWVLGFQNARCAFIVTATIFSYL